MTKSELKSSTSVPNKKVSKLLLLKQDFRLFLTLVWAFLGLPKPTKLQYDMAYWLQHGPKRAILMAFRGAAKSWITAAFVLWLLFRDPQHRVLVVSASGKRSEAFTSFCLRLIKEMPLLRHLIPGTDQMESRLSFEVGPAKPDQSPSVRAAGITGQITGSRALTIVADDVEVTNNSDTQGKREKLSEAVKEFDAILKPDPEARVIFLGTPQSDQTIYNELEERGYVIQIYPARHPDEKQLKKYAGKLAPMVGNALAADPSLVGRSTEPGRFTDDDLSQRELSYGRSGFALQFMLDTALSDTERYPLKLRDLVILSLAMDKAPIDLAWGPATSNCLEELPNVGFNGDRFYKPAWVAEQYASYNGTVMTIDPAGRGGDEVGFAIVSELHGRLFWRKVGGYKGGYAEATLKQLLQTAKRFGVNEILVEPNMGDGMFAQLLRAEAIKTYPVTITDAPWASSQKERRIIDTLEPIMNQNRLVVDQRVIEEDYNSTLEYDGDEDKKNCRVFYQMTRLTKEKGCLAHDDRIDALAMAVGYWVDRLNRNTASAAADHLKMLLEKEKERMLRGIGIGRPSRASKNWNGSLRKRRR